VSRFLTLCVAVFLTGVACDGCVFQDNEVVADSRTNMVEGGAVYVVTSSTVSASSSNDSAWVLTELRTRYAIAGTYLTLPAPSLFINSQFNGNIVSGATFSHHHSELCYVVDKRWFSSQAGVPLETKTSFGSGQGGAVSAKSSSPVSLRSCERRL